MYICLYTCICLLNNYIPHSITLCVITRTVHDYHYTLKHADRDNIQTDVIMILTQSNAVVHWTLSSALPSGASHFATPTSPPWDSSWDSPGHNPSSRVVFNFEGHKSQGEVGVAK